MRARDSGRRRRGFTLLEVLCAVAVLGIVLAALARASVMGLHNEGEAARRAQASLLADREIEGIEADLALGQAPRPGTDEDDQDGFLVKIDVKPFDALAEGLHAAPPLPSDQPSQELPPGPPTGLLASSRIGANPLLWVTVRVAWSEGVDERQVTRTTILYDAVAAEPLLAPVSGQGAQGQAGDQGQSPAPGQPAQPPTPGPTGVAR